MELFFLLLTLHLASPEKHSLKHVYTASSQLPDFPDIVAVVLVDGIQTDHYDSHTKRTVPTQVWMDRVRADDPEYWKKQTAFWEYQEERGRFRLDFFRKRFNQTEEFPLVSLLQKTPSSPVSCHASGFYPDRATMFWSRDGEEFYEDVNYGELLHNHDGTFQMSVDLNLSVVRPGDWSRYRCVFQFSDVDQAIVTKLDPGLIKTNWVEETSATALIISLSAVVALLVMATVIYVVYRKQKGKRPPDTPDSCADKLNPGHL